MENLTWVPSDKPADEWFYCDNVVHGHIWFGAARWWWSYHGFVKTPTLPTKADARVAVEKYHANAARDSEVQTEAKS